SIGIVLFMMTKIVPDFAEIFEKQSPGSALPPLTVKVIAISNFITDNWIELIGGLLGAFVLFLVFRATPVGKSVISLFKIKTPFLGDAFQKLYVSRFCRTLGSMIDSGVPILDSLLFARDAVGNDHIEGQIDKIHRRVKDGEPISKPLAATGVFPPMVSSMVEVGEETGDLPNMLNQVADIYDDEVDASLSAIASVIEPVLIIVLAIFVLTIAIAIFLPFIQMMQNMGV
ncbi:MAG: type II secretion system F family protein, partial [Verrucomicrobiota bacterium]